MSPLGYHNRIHLLDNHAIVRDDDQRREIARIVLKQGRRDGLLVFSLPDTHLHLLARCAARAAGLLNRRLESSLKQRLGLVVSFEAYRPEPILTQSHFHNTARYVLCQHERHGLDLAQFIEATNVPDLLGMRCIGQYSRDNLMEALPRLRRSRIQRWTGLADLQPADGPLSALFEATLAAAALADLRGKSMPVLDAKRALLEVAGPRLPGAELAQLLGVAERTLYTL